LRAPPPSPPPKKIPRPGPSRGARGRERGRPRTRHLARKLGILDAQNPLGLHTPSSPPFSACIILLAQSAGLGALEGGALRRWASAAPTVHGRCASRPAGDLAIAMGCPGRPGFAGVVSRVAELQLFCRRAARSPKCGWTRVSAFRRCTGSPIAPPRCAPSLGVPSRALAAGVALGPADCVPCARPAAAASARLARSCRPRGSPRRPAPAPATWNPPPWSCRAHSPAGGVGAGACVLGASPRGAPRARAGRGPPRTRPCRGAPGAQNARTMAVARPLFHSSLAPRASSRAQH
jgi:hypothetical protein